ncbi:hypothetical protein CAEBREN_17016 [Caenorhabditis brenneri]|uniref:Uncharacterized protein n=1 Tax=Caenorhabditis brenneri TaxID=135651 RepID=G0N448_CAEBE|nr:hypothetical protein CAEBREN_17016 [Caenorhabditis brenneri]
MENRVTKIEHLCNLT